MPEQNSQDNTAVISTSNSNTQKGGNNTKITFAAVIGILLLIIGVATGVYLVQREQEIRERAASGSECQRHPDCILLDEPGNQGTFSAPRNVTHLFITARDYIRFDQPGGNDGCYNVSIAGREIAWQRIGDGPDCKDVSNVQIWLGEASITATPPENLTQTPTLPPTVSARCNIINIYNESWNLLSQNDLSSLSPGEIVNIAVSGTTISGTFDMARFTINGALRDPVISKKPGSDEFYDDYIIPEGVTSFSIGAQLHHTTLGWF